MTDPLYKKYLLTLHYKDICDPQERHARAVSSEFSRDLSSVLLCLVPGSPGAGIQAFSPFLLDSRIRGNDTSLFR